MAEKKEKRNDLMLKLYKIGYTMPDIGQIMGITTQATSQTLKPHRSDFVALQHCYFCGSLDKRAMVIKHKAKNACKRCANKLRKGIDLIDKEAVDNF